MKKLISALIFANVLVLGAGVAGCAEEKGPMEKMGESMDEGVEEVKDEIDDAT